AQHVGPGIITGSVTTALAFFCALLTDFLGVAELGVIAGGGILLCALAAFIVMPALIAVADRNVEPRTLPTPLQGRALREALRRSPGGLALMAIMVIVFAGLSAPKVKYDYNLLNLQADGLESVEVQKKILKESDSGLLFAVSLANSPEEALRLKKKFEALPGVHHVQELASKLPRHPPEDTRLLVQGVQALLSHLPDEPPVSGPLDPASIGKGLEELDQTLGSIDQPLARQLSQTIDRFLDRLHELSFEQQQAMLTGYQHRLTADLLARMQGLASAANAEPIELADLPPGLASRLVSKDGKQWLLQIFPHKNIWEIEPLTEFIRQVRSVDPQVTGIPIQNFEASRQIRQSYETVALYALFVVFLTLLVDFLKLQDVLLALLAPLAQVFVIAAAAQATGSKVQLPHLVVAYALLSITLVAWIDWRGLRNSILAMLPPLAGAALMLGILGLIHVDLNPANLIVLPLIIGIGVDSGVHVLHDFRAQKGTYSPSPSTINAVVLTSLTTMVGFGSMMIAAHRGLWSLGVVLTVGVGSCLFVSLVLVPALLTLCDRLGQSLKRKNTKDEPPQSDAEALQSTDKPRELSVFYPESAESAA
ncbi:MAG TPA: MMPL family transporter, partial [Planctomycetaceae bacterium]|nr:MMPL family transporter [Planctomycetaceae bacterium]